MRTTLTLEDDVAAELRRIEGRTQMAFKAVVNDVLRRGLALGATPVRMPARFTVTPKATGLVGGVDPLKLNQLADELETERLGSDRRRKETR